MKKARQNTPLVSVLMPVYNAEAFLARTLDSLLCQTYKNFEIVAINDGSTDNSLDILQRYAHMDDRIVVINQDNKGLVYTLNKAAALAKGEYLARMDSDDLSLPRRFELQLEAFEKNKSAVLVAGCFDVINEDDETLYHESVPTEKEELKRALFARNPIAHGSVMLKKSVFEKVGGYSSECGPTEDYELWSRLIEFGDFVGVPATIFRWRINPDGITQSKSKIMAKHMEENIDKFLEKHPLIITGRSYLKKRGFYYVHSFQLHGVGMKESMFKDCLGVAMAFAQQGQFLKAFLQIFIVASTGRTGLRLTVDRVKSTSKYYLTRGLRSSN